MDVFPVYGLIPESPGRGTGLVLALAGTLLCFLSVLAYAPRNRLASFQSVGVKRLWLNLHMLLGLAGPALVVGHAQMSLLGIKGLANLAMWGTLLSGIIARFFAAQSPAARLKRQSLLEWLASSFDWEQPNETLFFLTSTERLKVLRALDRAAAEPPSGVVGMSLLFFRDLRVIWILLQANRHLRHGKRLSDDRQQCEHRRTPFSRAVGDEERSHDRRAPPEAYLLRLTLQRNLLLLNLQEMGAPFWVAMHKGFSLGFLLLLSLHMAVVFLFKPQFQFW